MVVELAACDFIVILQVTLRSGANVPGLFLNIYTHSDDTLTIRSTSVSTGFPLVWLNKRLQRILSIFDAHFPATTSECVTELFLNIQCV
jgi:hypothetical protein